MLCLSIQILDQVSINPDEAKVFTARNNQAKNRSSHYLPGAHAVSVSVHVGKHKLLLIFH